MNWSLCCLCIYFSDSARVVILGIQRPFGGHTRRPCPLCLIWTGRGIIDRETTIPNLLYCSNFSYGCPLTWSHGDWKSEVAVHRSASAPVWPFRFTMDGQSTPVWPLSVGHAGLSRRRAGGPPHKQPWFPHAVNLNSVVFPFILCFTLQTILF
jgi:hypothetical protein